MSAPAAEKHKVNGLYRQIAITADKNGQVPTRIELLHTGTWPASSNKGPLEETIASLYEYKRNFDAGIGQNKDDTGNYIGLPINYEHESWGKAAGWIKSMDVETLTTDPTVGVLVATEVEWTPAGAQAIIDGEYKCISPEWWPASRGDWTDPENPNITARNVIDGCALTNIPFFKDLVALKASRSENLDDSGTINIIYINADKEQKTMTLDEIRVKEASALTADERSFAEEHKSELTPDEQARLGLSANKDTDPTPTPIAADKLEAGEVAELRALNASIKSGESVVVKASVFNGMQTDVKAMKREKIEASVKEHVARGAIKADQLTAWSDKIEADASAEDLLKALPSNEALAASVGSDKDVSQETDEAALHAKTVQKIEAARSEGKDMRYSEARKLVEAEKES